MTNSPPDLRSLREPQKTFEQLENEAMRAQLRVLAEEIDTVRAVTRRMIVLVYFLICGSIGVLFAVAGGQ
jgi:hypothetical protein